MNRAIAETQPDLLTFPLPGYAASPRRGDHCTADGVTIHFNAAEHCYASWPAPMCIVSDGPYGVGGFPGDHHKPDALAEWYRPHVAAWSAAATPQTTLWFWCTEVGWAMVHPVLVAQGWEYRCCNVWDKGLGHIAGNVNTPTMRMYPVVTEVCVHYVRAVRFPTAVGSLSMQEWLRHEWQRSGLAYRLANEACGVQNAATRKYLTADHLWYYPPPDAFERMASFANEHGRVEGRPYFSLNGQRAMTADEWACMRAKFRCGVGITNVWRAPQVSGEERIRGDRQGMKYKFRSLHGSQKPLAFIQRIIEACTDEHDVVWEPFGGLCPGAVVCRQSHRRYVAAEIVPEFYQAATQRMRRA